MGWCEEDRACGSWAGASCFGATENGRWKLGCDGGVKKDGCCSKVTAVMENQWGKIRLG